MNKRERYKAKDDSISILANIIYGSDYMKIFISAKKNHNLG